MGLRVINHQMIDNGRKPAASSGIHAGMVVALGANATTGVAELSKADRANSTATLLGSIVGIAGDDATTTGNTQIIVNPVSLEFETHYARRIGDFQDEVVEGATNWTDTGTPKRGVTVYSVGGEFATDMYAPLFVPSAAVTDTAGTPGFVVNEALTVGSATTNTLQGYFVSLNSVATNTYTVLVLARVTDGVDNSCLFLRWNIES